MKTPLARRRVLTRLAPLLLLLGAAPLVASTCGGGTGPQTFARGSLIIPMDLCYQYQTDAVSGAYTPYQCPQTPDKGDVIKAYGLVYQLVRNNIPVYWIIDPQKTSLTGTDLTVSYTAGLPVLRYDWATGGTGAAPTTSHDVSYRGGPFVVDGGDLARASQVLQNYKTLYGTVKVHVANVAFTANVAKTMAGGWSAGGAVAPKLALLDIGSSGAGSKNSEYVIQGYLAKAGLDFAGAGGCVTPVNTATNQVRPECGSATPTHGQIYDRLYMEDFWPDASGAAATTNLFKEGYQILWVPHWAAPSSCSDCPAGQTCSCNTKYTQAQIDQALRTIGAFSAAGKDVFAECAGLGSFEGVSNSTYANTYQKGASDASTHFQTAPAATPLTAGLSDINKGSGAYFWPGNFSSPFLQLGDFPFAPAGGAIADYTSSVYRPDTVRFVSHASTTTSYDVFTILNRTASHGTIAYLGGHSYSGNDGGFQIAGTRLVLNTLFNLGAGCVESGVACNTGLLGVCSQGVLRCDADGRQVCTQLVGPSSEACNGLDDDCNGLVDDRLDSACYDGPAGTVDGSGNPKGICQKGVRSCQRNTDGSYAMSACQGEVLPSSEVCNGLDDDCNGVVDDAPVPVTTPPTPPVASSLRQACYTGPQSSLDPATSLPRGICKPGQQSCANGVWSACEVCDDAVLPWRTPASYPTCEILPHTEDCITEGAGKQYDMNCNGVVADNCGCTLDATQACYRGPTGTLGNGACAAGSQRCLAGTPNAWGPCSGDVLPGALDCTKPPASPPADGNCNGVADYLEPACNLCPAAGDPSLVCYVNADRSAPKGTCQDGTRSCAGGVLGDCAGLILPAPEVCDGKDNDCNGVVDDGASCGAGLACVNGACVPATCGVEVPCPDGYACSAGRCVLANCGTGGSCALGSVCQYGQCVDPCTGVDCGVGATCASGACSGGSCYFSGCPAGQLCQNGACAPDPCLGVVCPSGTFCRAGDCVQACTFVSCPAGQRCGADGFCEADPCAGKTCATGQRCDGGACVADPCAGAGCGQGQVCQGGVCVDDPCNGVKCPAGQCAGGQCYPTEYLHGTTPPPADAPKASGGCGCGSGSGSALSALLFLLAVPLARRRRRGGMPLAALAALAVLGGAACQTKEDPFDPSQCAETCGEQRCVELATDPVHCGACTNACGSGEICVDAHCGPGSAVAPYIRSVSPPTGPRGSSAPVEVTVGGERFAPGATLRTIAPAGTATYATTVTDAGHLTASLDLSGLANTELQLRVVNPDRVISNAVPFDVITPTPQLTGVQPVPVTAGAKPVLTVTGTGFIDSSKCHVSGPSTTDLALPTTPGAPLRCTFDSTGLPIGAYDLWVVNDGVLASNHLPFSITASGAPHLLSLSPSAAATGDTIALTVTGTGFGPASAVSVAGFTPAAQTTTYVDATRLLVPSLATTQTAGTYQVTVSGADNSLPLTISATAPRADTMTPTPGSPYQGATVTLAFTGANLAGATGATIQPPAGAAITAPLAGTPTATAASVTVNLATACGAAVCPAGLYGAALGFPGGGSSSTFQFRVLSNAAVLQAVTPAGGAQGTNPVTVTFTAANLRGTQAAATVVFKDAGGTAHPASLVAPWTPPTLATASLDLRGLDTGVYSLAIQNGGAQPSNAVSFTVTPGQPHLTSVSPSSVTQRDAPWPIALTGSNFAKPDANGNAASQVMVLMGAGWLGSHAYAAGDVVSSGDNTYRCTAAGTSAASGGPSGTGSAIADGGATWTWAGTWFTLPAGNTATVTDSATISVQFDTRTAVPGTYQIQVWNPPGPMRSERQALTVN